MALDELIARVDTDLRRQRRTRLQGNLSANQQISKF